MAECEVRCMNTLTPAQRDRVLALLRQGRTLRAIEAETGHRRETIAAYGRHAGLIDGTVPTIAPPERGSICDAHREAIGALLDRGLSLRSVHEQLVRDAGFDASYSTLKLYVRAQRLRGTQGVLAAA